MKLKQASILLCFVFLLACVHGQTETSIGNCENLQLPWQKEKCFENSAIFLNDSTLCNISGDYIGHCYYQLGLKLGSSVLCESADKFEKKCISELALQAGDPTICKGDIDCIIPLVETSKNYEVCNLSLNSDECLLQVYTKSGDEEICNYFKTPPAVCSCTENEAVIDGTCKKVECEANEVVRAHQCVRMCSDDEVFNEGNCQFSCFRSGYGPCVQRYPIIAEIILILLFTLFSLVIAAVVGYSSYRIWKSGFLQGLGVSIVQLVKDFVKMNRLKWIALVMSLLPGILLIESAIRGCIPIPLFHSLGEITYCSTLPLILLALPGYLVITLLASPILDFGFNLPPSLEIAASISIGIFMLILMFLVNFLFYYLVLNCLSLIYSGIRKILPKKFHLKPIYGLILLIILLLGVAAYYFTRTDSGNCYMNGGKWASMSNSCVDTCGSEPRVCLAAFTTSCDLPSPIVPRFTKMCQ